MQVHSTVRSCNDFISLGSHIKADNAISDQFNVLLRYAVEANMRSIAGKHSVI